MTTTRSARLARSWAPRELNALGCRRYQQRNRDDDPDDPSAEAGQREECDAGRQRNGTLGNARQAVEPGIPR
jgi:hypothetical protein